KNPSSASSMSFLHLSLLAGLGAVSIPILLHLFGRSQPQVIDFPALRFVQQTTQEQSMSWQLRHMLLLLLRVLLLAALALALARPRIHSMMFGNVLTGSLLAGCALLASVIAAVAFVSRRSASVWLTAALVAAGLWIAAALWSVTALAKGPSVPSSDQSAPVAAVLIIDNGPTMSYRTDNTTRLELARDMGVWILDQLPLDSRVGILAGAPLGSLALDPATAKSQLKIIETRGAHVDLLARIRTALDLVLASELERKEIYVVTDLMSASWLASTGGLTELLGAHVEDVLLQVIDVGAEDHVNFRLGDPLVDFDTVPAGGEVAIEIDVHRPDNTAGEGLNIELHQEQVDSKSPPIISDGKLQITNVKVVDRQVAEFGSSETARVTLRASDLVAGSHNFTIRLDRPDPLLVDNQRFLTVLAQQQRPTLIVADDVAIGQNLQAIVDPSSFASGKSEESAVDQVRYVQLSNVPLEKYSVICLYDPPPLTDKLVQSLQQHVAGGGGLFLILGPSQGTLESIQGNPLTDLLPGPLSALAIRRTSDPLVYPEPVALSHPVFFALGQSPDEVIWNVYPIYRNWDFSSLADGVITLMRLSDGSAPFLTLESRGRGEILTLTTPIPEFDSRKRELWNLLWTSDPLPAFAILLGSFRSLSGANRESLNYEVGQAVALSNDPLQWPSRYDLMTPDAHLLRPSATEGTLNLGAFEQAGIYRLRGQRNEAVARSFSVNVPASDTAAGASQSLDLDERLGRDHYRLAHDRSEVESSVGQARFGRELYPLLMLLVAGLFLAEQAMSNRFYQIKLGR
ncbi:MAG: BatA domain-containing protein, partial [Pirellulaceae bacterium]